jgi:hypothetical protein
MIEQKNYKEKTAYKQLSDDEKSLLDKYFDIFISIKQLSRNIILTDNKSKRVKQYDDLLKDYSDPVIEQLFEAIPILLIVRSET